MRSLPKASSLSDRLTALEQIICILFLAFLAAGVVCLFFLGAVARDIADDLVEINASLTRAASNPE